MWPPHEELAPTDTTNATPSAARSCTSSSPAKPPPPPQPTMASPPHPIMTPPHLYAQIAIPLGKNDRRPVEMATIYRFCALDSKIGGETKRSARGRCTERKERDRGRTARGERRCRSGLIRYSSATGKPKTSSVAGWPKRPIFGLWLAEEARLRPSSRTLRPGLTEDVSSGFRRPKRSTSANR